MISPVHTFPGVIGKVREQDLALTASLETTIIKGAVRDVAVTVKALHAIITDEELAITVTVAQGVHIICALKFTAANPIDLATRTLSLVRFAGPGLCILANDQHFTLGEKYS